MNPRLKRALTVLAWIALAAPALYQLGLLVTAIAGRIGYPYDLEWMEGGLLHHAERIRDGQGIYVAPSMDFIPYLYTPLYPALLAGLDGVFGVGLSYAVGRAVSVLALLGIAGVAWRSLVGPARRAGGSLVGPAACGAVLALGVFAAGYPYVEGWYDLVRADTLALLMVTGGVHAAARWAARDGRGGHGAALALGVLMALAFFTKQTAILYVAWAGGVFGLLRLIRAARARALRPLWPALTYAAAAGVVGLGGAALLDGATGGWFWTYAFKIHQAHDFNMDRFWKSFGNILWHWPALTLVIGGTAVVVFVRSLGPRGLPPAARPFVLWAATYALSTVVGAVGWGTEFAHFNAYMPALLHGGLAVGAAVPALAACWPEHAQVRRGVAVAAALIVGVTLARATWKPATYVPTAADRAGGDAVIAAIRAVDGDVWVPYHPWYARLAGKRPFVHRMGIRDVTARSPRKVAGLAEAARDRRFAGIVFDNRPPFDDLPEFARGYRAQVGFVPGRPRVFTGAKVVPDALWVSNAPSAVPAGARVLFDFEQGGWIGWEVRGNAWGKSPTGKALPGQAQPRGADGRSYATSMWGGDKAIGTAYSPGFVLDGARLTLRLGGGTDPGLRVELQVDGRPIATASVPGAPSETLREVSMELPADMRGQVARLVLVDDATGTWGHLTVDEVWLWTTALGAPRE